MLRRCNRDIPKGHYSFYILDMMSSSVFAKTTEHREHSMTVAVVGLNSTRFFTLHDS